MLFIKSSASSLLVRFAEIRLLGRVQGVGLRGAVAARAITLGFGGWARNEDDGSVLVRLEGEAGKIEEFINWAASLHSPYGIDISSVVRMGGGEMEEKETKANAQKTRQQKPRFDIF